MILLKIAWRNVWRNRRRTILTLCALAFSNAMLLFMFAWQNGSYDAMIHAAVNSTTGELQVMASGYSEKRDIRKGIAEPEVLLEWIRSRDNVQAATARAEAFALADSGRRSYGVMVVGIDPVHEPEVGNIRSIIREGGYFTGDPLEIILGRNLADNLQVGMGDEIVLLGQGRDGSVAASAFRVQGIAESGQVELDRSLAKIPLAAFQETFRMDGHVHRIVVNCASLDDLPGVMAQLDQHIGVNYPDLETLSWDELVPGLKQSIELDLISGYVFYFLLLVVVAFSIMNTFIMAVMERTREFGILNAIGTARRRLVRILLLETFLLGLCGVVLGMVLGLGAAFYAQEVGIVIPDSENLMAKFGLPGRIYPQLSWFIALLAPLLVIGVTLFSSIYPAIRVSRLQPVAAMHDQ